MNFYQFSTSGHTEFVHDKIIYDVHWYAKVMMRQWWEFNRLNYSCKLTIKDFYDIEFLNTETDECASKELFEELLVAWGSKDFSYEESSIEKDAMEENE